MKKKKNTKENKGKKKYSRSFARRLTWKVVLALLLTMGFSSYLIASFSWAIIIDMMTTSYAEVLNSSNQYMRRMLSDIYVATTNTVPDIEANLDHPDRLPSLLERIVRLNPRIRSCGVSFVDGYYPQKGRWYSPCAKRLDNDSIVVELRGDAQKDYLTQEWFLEAKDTTEGYWSKPFFDSTDSIPLTAYMVPIHDRHGRTVAVLGADLSLQFLRNKLEEGDQKIELSAKDSLYTNQLGIYTFILDGEGTYISHPEEERILKNYFTYASQTPDTLDDYVGRLMVARKKGIFDEDKKGNALRFDSKEKVFLFYAPIKYVDWSLGIVVPTLTTKILAYVVAGIMVFLILLAVLVAFFVCRFSIRRSVKPLKTLAVAADEIAQGHFDTPLPVIKTRDEVHQLRDSFEGMQHSLTRYVKQLQTTTAQRASMENELKIAHEIQMSMLPKTFPPYPNRSDIDVYGSLTPAKAIGGDLFDFAIHDEKFFFCIGDVSGKGVPASLVMAVTRTLFHNISGHFTEPDDIVKALNDTLVEDNDTSMFVTFLAGVLDLKTGLLRYCNAAHDAPMLLDGDATILPCDPNVPLGVVPDWPFTLQETTLRPGDTLFLYTDGLNEAEDHFHVQFGEERILWQARQSAAEGFATPREFIEGMKEAVRHFVGTAEQSDDLTMLAISYKSNA